MGLTSLRSLFKKNRILPHQSHPTIPRNSRPMKSLPRTPSQSTASTLTATMMARAFQSNHHKRGLAEMMAPPPTPTSQQTSYLDCQSLQSSLKRVRLSSSPGELRLQRDLRHMVSSGSWIPKHPQDANNDYVWHPPAPPVTARTQKDPPPPRIELQQVESLRLRLSFERSVVAWIQIPRMYPHRPPLISRIVYNNQQQHHAGIQSILVHEAPPTQEIDSGDESPDTEHSVHCANTVVYSNWSPVQRLGDLLDFVIDTFRKQHEDMGLGNVLRNNSTNDVSLTYSSSSLSSNSSWSNSRRSSTSSITSSTTGNTSGGHRTSASLFPGWIQQEYSKHQTEDMTIDGVGGATSTADFSTFLAPNRFDVGYDRAIPPVTMDVDKAIPQQVSMNMSMDL